ncbi:DinB family protein [Frigoriflavimonas asaccharolytica]|nr:DinB family protein [Frigoriflavimonas asaccharolytica]
MNAQEFLKKMQQQSREISDAVRKLQSENLERLIFKNDANQWNILECVEHLNLYAQFYIPQFEEQLYNNTTKPNADFKSGILGSYFCKSILPKENLKKIKTFQNKNPLNHKLSISVIDDFLNYQDRFALVLENAEKVDLNKIKIKTTIASFIRINLGDAMQFYVNHNIRHLHQISNLIKNFH